MFGDTAHTVKLSQGAMGAVLAFDTTTIPFGSVPVSGTQSSGLRLTNSGNAAARVTLSVDNAAFSVSPSTQVSADAGTALSASASFSPTDTMHQVGALTVATMNPVCQPLPAAVMLSGTGQNGGVTLSPNALTFGPTNCGTTAAPRSFTLTNSGNSPLSWNASLGPSPSPVCHHLHAVDELSDDGRHAVGVAGG